MGRYLGPVSSRERNPELPDPLRPSRETMRETLVERQIREAIESGDFDGLPHQGNAVAAGGRFGCGRLGARPPHAAQCRCGAAVDRIRQGRPRAILDERDRLLARAARLSPTGLARARDEITRIVDAANRAIARVNAEAPTLRQHRRPLDLATELDRLERAAGSETRASG